MKILIAILLSVPAMAATTEYDIHAQLYVGGKLVSSPRILTLPGEAAELSQFSDFSTDKLHVRIVATDDNAKIQDGILMKFDIYYRKGTKIIESSPEILAKPGAESTVKIGKRGRDSVELKVTANRL